MDIALTIAGSDSGGGAGIQADLKSFTRFGVFGTSAITAITAQNTKGVTMWEVVSPALVRAQIDSIFEDLPPQAVKTGMLGSVEIAGTVVDALRVYQPSHLVVDPVMVATSGDILLDEAAVSTIRRELLPLSTLVTPNLDEVRVLLGVPIQSLAQMREAAKALVHELGAKAALVKGGHLPGDMVSDVLYDGVETYTFEHSRVFSNNVHGTGCTLSAAITAKLASGSSLVESVKEATDYVHRSIISAHGLGSGHGPLNHWA